MASSYENAFATRAASSRPRSEDRAEVFAHEDTLVIVVADGAGGVGGGATASAMVVDAVRAKLADRPFDPYDLRAWSDLLTRTDEALARGAAGGETTAILTVVGPHGLAGVSAGDSEAWLVERRIDRLTEKQDRTRLGTGRSRATPFHRRRMDGVLVVATDGLFRHAPSAAIVTSCTSETAATIADRLVALPKLRSGTYPDDVAIVVVRPAL